MSVNIPPKEHSILFKRIAKVERYGCADDLVHACYTYINKNRKGTLGSYYACSD